MVRSVPSNVRFASPFSPAPEVNVATLLSTPFVAPIIAFPPAPTPDQAPPLFLYCIAPTLLSLSPGAPPEFPNNRYPPAEAVFLI